MSMMIPIGAMTALITPFMENGCGIDWQGLQRLIDFQIQQKISGIVPTGTTGESPTLTEAEHDSLIQQTLLAAKKIFVMPGCGSNSTREAMHYVKVVAEAGGRAVLLVDPYYNGPSTLEMCQEYYGPIAATFSNIIIVPYIIPGRTGTKLWPEDLAELSRQFPNICAVKEATNDISNMKLTRYLAPPYLQITSGDDGLTFDMITEPMIGACGVISVVSNIAPAAVQEMCLAALRGDIVSAARFRDKLQPLFDIVTVFAERIMLAPKERTGTMVVTDKFRNPLPIKTAMNALGMPSGPCRQPLGKMSFKGMEKVRAALKIVWLQNPEVLAPIEEFFKVNIGQRLADNNLWMRLAYL